MVTQLKKSSQSYVPVKNTRLDSKTSKFEDTWWEYFVLYDTILQYVTNDITNIMLVTQLVHPPHSAVSAHAYECVVGLPEVDFKIIDSWFI